VARRLQFTVDQEPILIEIGGDEFTAPPVLAPASLADLLDKRTTMNESLGALTAQADAGERGAIDTLLGVVARRPTCPHCDAPLSADKGLHAADPPTNPPTWTAVCPATGQPYQPATGIFDVILTDEKSAQLFRERLYSRTRPFDLIRELIPAITGLIEEYTGRPTQPSSPSWTPSPGDGTASTDGAPPAMSIPSPRALPADGS
jgi:hypothetical protein